MKTEQEIRNSIKNLEAGIAIEEAAMKEYNKAQDVGGYRAARMGRDLLKSNIEGLKWVLDK